MKNQMSSKSQGRVAYVNKKKHKSESTKKLLHLMLQQHCAVHHATAVPLPNAIASRPAALCAAGIAHRGSGGAESIIVDATSSSRQS